MENMYSLFLSFFNVDSKLTASFLVANSLRNINFQRQIPLMKINLQACFYQDLFAGLLCSYDAIFFLSILGSYEYKLY